jgi:hypothetical protein
MGVGVVHIVHGGVLLFPHRFVQVVESSVAAVVTIVARSTLRRTKRHQEARSFLD